MKRWYLFILLILPLVSGAMPPLQHGEALTLEEMEHLDITQYWVSEKLDGVRGYWDGKQLKTRQGVVINAPQWYLQSLGDVPLDGELWIERESFERVNGLIRKNKPDDQEWRTIRFMIFDLPAHEGDFDARVAEMERYIPSLNVPWVAMIPQLKCKNHADLEHHLEEILNKGGEGLMLHYGKNHYQEGRTANLLKLKPTHDKDGRVIAHLEGEGRFEGMMGALLVELADGKELKIGSGFSDEERKNPPKIGDIITFTYNGYTKNGLPRFARYVRTRYDKQLLD